MLTLAAAPVPGLAPPPPPLRITCDQYARNVAAGVYPPDRRIELLDGIVVLRDARDSAADRITQMGPQHATLTKRARKILEPLAEAAGCVYRDQVDVTLPPHNDPAPDGVIATGTDADYDGRHPVAAEIVLLLEVADSSLANDRTSKARIYASSGVRTYWILNVPARTLEVRTDPDVAGGFYRSAVTLTAADAATVPLPGGGVPLPLADLLA